MSRTRKTNVRTSQAKDKHSTQTRFRFAEDKKKTTHWSECRNRGTKWTSETNEQLFAFRQQDQPYEIIGEVLGRSALACRLHYHQVKVKSAKATQEAVEQNPEATQEQIEQIRAEVAAAEREAKEAQRLVRLEKKQGKQAATRRTTDDSNAGEGPSNSSNSRSAAQTAVARAAVHPVPIAARPAPEVAYRTPEPYRRSESDVHEAAEALNSMSFTPSQRTAYHRPTASAPSMPGIAQPFTQAEPYQPPRYSWPTSDMRSTSYSYAPSTYSAGDTWTSSSNTGAFRTVDWESVVERDLFRQRNDSGAAVGPDYATPPAQAGKTTLPSMDEFVAQLGIAPREL